MALYTGKGDKGDTGFIGSKERVSKASTRPEALGALDELNSFLGIVKVGAEEKKLLVAEGSLSVAKIVSFIQNNLFIIGSELAGSDKTITEVKVKKVENIIARIEKELPEIKHFRIAGGTVLSAQFDFARSLARRLERRAIAYVEQNPEAKLSEHTRQFLNRLSSLLYALARLSNIKSGITEESPTYE